MRYLIFIVIMFTSVGSFLDSAHAFPPRLGIDLSTVLSIRDQARKVRFDGSNAKIRNFRTIKTIVIDPGHGGENHGALGVAEIQEKFLTMELAYALRDALQEKYPKVRVVLTRYWDQELGLRERASIANFREADLFISLHYNAATHGRALGFETYFLKSGWVTPSGILKEREKKEETTKADTKKTKKKKVKVDSDHSHVMTKVLVDLKRQKRHKNAGRFARAIQKSLKIELDSIDRGVKQENFTVLRGARMPAIVVEAGFLTNEKEGHIIVKKKHRERVVNALLNGIEAFDDELASNRK